jgi:hypothetical protein
MSTSVITASSHGFQRLTQFLLRQLASIEAGKHVSHRGELSLERDAPGTELQANAELATLFLDDVRPDVLRDRASTWYRRFAATVDSGRACSPRHHVSASHA